MILIGSIHDEWVDPFDFVAKNKEVIHKMFIDATSIIARDNYEDQDSYDGAISALVLIHLYNESIDIHGSIEALEMQEDIAERFFEVIWLEKNIFDLINRGFVQAVGDKFIVTKKGKKILRK